MFISTVEINDVTGKVSPAEQSTCLQPSEEQMIDEMSTVHFQTPWVRRQIGRLIVL